MLQDQAFLKSLNEVRFRLGINVDNFSSSTESYLWTVQNYIKFRRSLEEGKQPGSLHKELILTGSC